MFNKLSLNFAAFLSEQPGPPQYLGVAGGRTFKREVYSR